MLAVEICPSCGEPAFFGVADLWYVTREIEVDACCETNLAGWMEAFFDADLRTRVDWMWRETCIAARDVIANESRLIRLAGSRTETSSCRAV